MKKTDQNKLRVGIAGYGVVGHRRHDHIRAHSDLEVVAVCDRRIDDLEGPGAGIRTYHDYQELLQEDLDVLFVSLPNYLAPEVTIAGLEADLHVFCEKPPGRTLADIEKVYEASQKRPHLKLKYGFNHRYHESIKEALRLIESANLGPLVNMRGLYGKSIIISYEEDGWRSERQFAGGGILLDQGIHMVDLLRLFGGEFVEVKSFISNEFWNFDVEDNAYALMRTENNVIALLHSSATQWQHRFSLELNFRDAYIKLEGILSGSKSYGEETLTVGERTRSDTGNLKHATTRYLVDNSWRDEVYEFADAITHDRSIANGSVRDALSTMKLVYEIYRADTRWASRFPEILAPSPETN